MIQSTWQPGIHVAVIMDGNGRWATRQGLPRAAGHREGVMAVRRIVESAPGMGISTLTLFAFSSDNWRRPERETQWLMRLFREYLRSEVPRCVATGVRLSIIGRRDRLPRGLPDAMREAEQATGRGARLHLRLAVDYSSRDAILAAATRAGAGATRDALARELGGTAAAPDVDLLIRTGGEQRLSDFLLWECAYAELVFTPCMWPDFTETELAAALHAFRIRERRFGALPAEAAADSRRLRSV